MRDLDQEFKIYSKRDRRWAWVGEVVFTVIAGLFCAAAFWALLVAAFVLG